MEVLILGSGTCVPTRKRFSPGLLITYKDITILIDPSAGTQKRLIDEGIHSSEIDVILISHFHPDHCGDLIPLLFNWKCSLSGRTKPLTLIGPRGLKNLYDDLSRAYHLDFSSPDYRLSLKEMIHEESCSYHELILTACAIRHAPESVGFRISSPEHKTIAYTGDTAASPDVISLCADADLAIMECSFPEQHDREGHLIPSAVADIGTKSKCKKILLTHFYPVIDDDEVISVVSKKFTGGLYLAEDGFRISV